MISIERPVHDVIMHVNTRRSCTTAYFFNNSLSNTGDLLNRPYETLLKSYYTDELNSSLWYIYCWYLIYRRLNCFYVQGVLLIHLAVDILDDLQSHRFTDSPVAMAYGQLAKSTLRHWFTVFISYGLFSKPPKRDLLLLSYGWANKPLQKYIYGNG